MIGIANNDEHAASCSRLARALGSAGRAKQNLGSGVFQIEGDLILTIARIERRGRSRHRGGQKADDGRQTVGKIGRDAVPSRHA